MIGPDDPTPLPDGYEVDDLTDEDLAPEGHPEHDCDGDDG